MLEYNFNYFLEKYKQTIYYDGKEKYFSKEDIERNFLDFFQNYEALDYLELLFKRNEYSEKIKVEDKEIEVFSERNLKSIIEIYFFALSAYKDLDKKETDKTKEMILSEIDSFLKEIILIR